MKILGGRFFALLSGSLLFVALASLVESTFMRVEASSAVGKILFFLLFNANLLALLFLMYFVARGLHRLFLERRHRTLGYRFKTKVVSFFVVLVSIPAGLLFLFSSGLGANYIERLFTPEFKKPLESSVAVAGRLYDLERSRVLHFAKMARLGYAPPSYYKVVRMGGMPEDASAAIKSAFAGTAETEVISGEDSDTVRAAVPVSPEEGIIVVESSIPPDITRDIESIKTAYSDYIKLEAWRLPLKLNYLLMLGFFTLIIVFAALWFSLRMAESMTEPVRELAAATEAVAGGDLSVSLSSGRKDELGLLIASFNRMVGELREGKDSLEKAYADSDERRLMMENILEHIQSGVISLDEKGNVRTINPAALKILNLEADRVLGKFHTEITSGIKSEEFSEMIKSINIRTFRSLTREVWVKLGGRKALLKVSFTGLRDSVGRYLGLLVVLDDLTGFVKAQRAVAWQEVARRMAHEIKNPLTPIKLSTERMLKKWLMRDEDFGQVFERSTETIIKEVDGLRNLVDEFSRLGKMPRISKAPADLQALLENVAALYKGYKDLIIKIDAPAGMPPVWLDAGQIRRVMINLFDNALQAMGGMGKIEVSIGFFPEENRLSVEVSDEGQGIRDDDKERLFQPYFSTKKDGTGLGLAIADKIIADHGGSITFRDNVPRGSVFAIEVPLRESEGQA